MLEGFRFLDRPSKTDAKLAEAGKKNTDELAVDDKVVLSNVLDEYTAAQDIFSRNRVVPHSLQFSQHKEPHLICSEFKCFKSEF